MDQIVTCDVCGKEMWTEHEDMKHFCHDCQKNKQPECEEVRYR